VPEEMSELNLKTNLSLFDGPTMGYDVTMTAGSKYIFDVPQMHKSLMGHRFGREKRISS
jgi:hypothetical protein